MRNYRGFRGTPWASRLLLAACLLAAGRPLEAGGGPENVLLVVNSADAGSQTIANHYAQLREIPPSNVIYLDWRGSNSQIDVDTFREKILRPISDEIVARNLSSQIDYMVYSSQFPYYIDFGSDVPADLLKTQLFQFHVGSLSGLTYLMKPVMAKDVTTYAGMTSNHYMRLHDSLDKTIYDVPVVATNHNPDNNMIAGRPPQQRREPVGNDFTVGSHGFRNWYGWGPAGELMEAGGQRYLLSAMLGVTFGRGNSLTEILNYLRLSAPADGTHPKGTIYFMDNKNDAHRSGPRSPAFETAASLLRQLGVAASIVQGDIPHNRTDVQGLMTGAAEFNWSASGSLIRPGAICDNLTSFGGDFDPKQGQTALSEFLRYGAAGASGTVAEPYAIQNKFPYALIQVHYARGCTLAEAFYQSVYAPYQLLVVGDPLCRPWANIPQVTVQGVKAWETLKGKVTLNPWGTTAAGGTVDRFQLFVDGLLIAVCPGGENLEFDSARYCDGYHELRVVGIESSAIESQGRLIIPVHFNNYGKKMKFEAPLTVRAGQPIKLKATAPGTIGVAFYHNKENVIAKFNGASGETTVNSAQLGEGPVTLQAIGWGSGGLTKNTVIADPVQITIEGGPARN